MPTTTIASAALPELKPGRLAGAARRPADAYGGEMTIELIAADRRA